MYEKFNEDELRSICRSSIEALEKWARIIIDLELSEIYGPNYFNIKLENGESLIKKEITSKADKMMSEHPNRFQRKIDTLFIDEVIYILCKHSLYKNIFKKVLDETYPDGCQEAHTYLSRLIPIRNKLSHGNPISIHEAEQAVCYTNDFIFGVKKYFEKRGNSTMFNVPQAIRLNDSLGNEFVLSNTNRPEVIRIKDSSGKMHKFYIDDKYSLWITMDPSFEKNEYTIEWKISSSVVSTSDKADLEITESMVATSTYITCAIKQNKKWHKYTTGVDHEILISILVLPPIE